MLLTVAAGPGVLVGDGSSVTVLSVGPPEVFGKDGELVVIVSVSVVIGLSVV